MRLHIDIREGDHVDTRHQPYGVRVSRALDEAIGSGAFAIGRDGDAGLRRWTDLDRRTLADTFEVSVPASLALRELKALCPADTANAVDSWFAEPVTGERLPEELTLAETDLADGDVLVLCVEHPPEASYRLAPASNPAELLRRLQLTENADAPDGGPRLWGVLLYTQADVELAAYVRTHFDDLNALSGPATRIFVVERLPDRGAARTYWRRHLAPDLYRVMSRMRWLQWQPYDPQGAYEIAGLLGLDVGLLPCLVFFHAGRGPVHRGEKVVFRIEDVSLPYFRTLFGQIAEALGSPRQVAVPDRWWEEPVVARQTPRAGLRALAAHREADAEAFARVREAAASIRDALRPAEPAHPGHTHTFHDCRVVITSGASVSENFSFQGTNTTFINRPQDVVVRDFQNTYASGTSGAELTRLLELVLSSRDLSDTGRAEAAGAVHDLARVTGEPEPDASAVRTRLERLREILAGGADIAQPALAIVASLAALFAA
ncbi:MULTISPECIES: hypothetical protein [unclassified Streptomyces]|uniref:hypothetical protein n=1 Tax=unclassified Streptomyces TaxID=2593676 RepID=UPI00332D9424